MKEINKQK
jgi:hypothetical protein